MECPLGRAAIITVAASLVLAACSAGPASVGPGPGGGHSSSVVISGSVTAGPTCPVQRVGQSCPPAPVHGKVVAENVTGGSVASASTAADGHYRLTLPTGRYTLVVMHTGAMRPRCPSTPITVRPGPPVAVDINCDTGIR